MSIAKGIAVLCESIRPSPIPLDPISFSTPLRRFLASFGEGFIGAFWPKTCHTRAVLFLHCFGSSPSVSKKKMEGCGDGSDHSL